MHTDHFHTIIQAFRRIIPVNQFFSITNLNILVIPPHPPLLRNWVALTCIVLHKFTCLILSKILCLNTIDTIKHQYSFQHSTSGKTSFAGWPLYVWMPPYVWTPPICLDAPLCLDAPICLDIPCMFG